MSTQKVFAKRSSSSNTRCSTAVKAAARAATEAKVVRAKAHGKAERSLAKGQVTQRQEKELAKTQVLKEEVAPREKGRAPQPTMPCRSSG